MRPPTDPGPPPPLPDWRDAISDDERTAAYAKYARWRSRKDRYQAWQRADLAVCGCGFPFPPHTTYKGEPMWPRRRRYCSKRCARSIPARLRRRQRQQDAHRLWLRRWEEAGQLTLW